MCLCGLTRGKGGEWTAADTSPGSSMAARASGREQAVRGRGAPSGGERGRIARREWCGRGGFREQYASRGSSREAYGGHRRRSAAGQERSGRLPWWSCCVGIQTRRLRAYTAGANFKGARHTWSSIVIDKATQELSHLSGPRQRRLVPSVCFVCNRVFAAPCALNPPDSQQKGDRILPSWTPWTYPVFTVYV